MSHSTAQMNTRPLRGAESRLPAQGWDALLRPLLPAEMPLIPGNRLLEQAELEGGRQLVLLHNPGATNGEDQYRYNLVLRHPHGENVWLGGASTPGDAPRFWSVEARLELSAEDVLNGLYHAGWEYKPFVDWLEHLASLRIPGSAPRIAQLLEVGRRCDREARGVWPQFLDPIWIDGEVASSFPGPVNGATRDSTLELQRLELAKRFGMPVGAFRREAHRWTVDWRFVPSSHPAKGGTGQIERRPTFPSIALRLERRTRARIRPSLSLAGMYRAMPDRRALVETLAAGVRKGAGRPGANVGMMWKLATASLYASGDLPVLAAREALQNSRDSIRAAYRQRTLKAGEGRFEIRWDAAERRLMFDDNGVGMDTATILGPFLTLGESTKRGEDSSDSAGGFGIAKAVILGASSTMRWELHTRDNRAVSEGPGQDVEVFEAEFRPGVGLILLDVPGDAVWDYVQRTWRDMGSRMKELLASCDLPDIQLLYNGEPVPPSFSRRKGAAVQVDGSWGAGTTARVKAYRRSDRGGAYWIRLDGLFQFKQASVTGNLRADVVIDLTPTARPGEPGYPLNAGRDQFVEPARSTFRAVVREVEKESQSVGKKREDEVFPLEDGTEEDAETRDALEALNAGLMDDPELAALLGEPEHGESPTGRGAIREVDADPPGEGSVAGNDSADILRRFFAGADLQFITAPAVNGGESRLPPAIVELDPHAVLPVWGADSELPGFPSELNTPAQVRRLFQTMAVVGHDVPMSAHAALDAALSGTLTGNDLRELADATTVALDVFAGRMAPESAGTDSPDALEQVLLSFDDSGQPVLPDRFLSPDPGSLRLKLLSADARGHHFPAPVWDSLAQVETTGGSSRQQLHMLSIAEEEAVAVNAGSVAPIRIPLAPLDVPDPEAYATTQHKKYVSLDETGGRLPGLPPGLNTYDQVKAFLTDGLRQVPGAVPEDEVERVLGAIATDPIHHTELLALVELVRNLGQALELKTGSIDAPAAPRARVNAGGVVRRRSGVNPFGGAAAVRIAASYPKDRARAFKRNPARWLPYLALWTLALKLVVKEAKISARYKPGFLLDDDTIGLASKQPGDPFALILVNADRFEETVKANRERPLSIAAFVHGIAVHELAHLDGKMGDGHDEEFVAKREDLGTETAHLLPVLTKAAVKLLKLPEPKDPLQAKLLKLERDLERARAGRDAARADRTRAARELEKALRDCRRLLAEQGAPESVRTGQACAASESTGVPSHIVVPSKVSTSQVRESFTEFELWAVRAGTQSFEGARHRWAQLAVVGATDEELAQSIAFELGVGGLTGPGGLWVEYSGRTLSVTLKPRDGAATSIKGKRLLRAARQVYGIDLPPDADPKIRRVLILLMDQLRKGLPEGVAPEYLYGFFARHRATFIDALARRFGASDPTLLPATAETTTGDTAEESLPRWTATPFSRPAPGERVRPLEYGDSIPGADWLRIGDPVRFIRPHRCPVWQVAVNEGTLGTVESESFGQVAVLLETPIQNPDQEDLRGWIETVHVPLEVLEDVLEVH